ERISTLWPSATAILIDIGADALGSWEIGRMPRHQRSHAPARHRFDARFAGIALAALLGLPGPSVAQMVQTDLDMTDGPVYAVALAGNNIYLGGDFARVGP